MTTTKQQIKDAKDRETIQPLLNSFFAQTPRPLLLLGEIPAWYEHGFNSLLGYNAHLENNITVTITDSLHIFENGN